MSQEVLPMRELPVYKSHKLVRALKISSMNLLYDCYGTALIVPADQRYKEFLTCQGWSERFKGDESDFGYWVLYEDGYESWSPSYAFENGYSLVMPAHCKRSINSHKVNGLNEAISIEVLDDPGAGNACHEYVIAYEGKDGSKQYTTISFQNGPIKEVGFNGISQEALLAIVEDRLASFQAGPFACEENAEALDYVRKAQETLQRRTRMRMAQGVEGEHKQHVS